MFIIKTDLNEIENEIYDTEYVSKLLFVSWIQPIFDRFIMASTVRFTTNFELFGLYW